MHLSSNFLLIRFALEAHILMTFLSKSNCKLSSLHSTPELRQDHPEVPGLKFN